MNDIVSCRVRSRTVLVRRGWMVLVAMAVVAVAGFARARPAKCFDPTDHARRFAKCCCGKTEIQR